MVISVNSQLGLMMWDRHVMIQFLEDSKLFLNKEMAGLNAELSDLQKLLPDNCDLPPVAKHEGDRLCQEIYKRLGYNPENHGSEFYTIKHPAPYWYLIQASVHKCAELIKVNENFSCSIFNKIKDGEHVYLLGKNSFYRFTKFNGAIRASFWDKEKNTAFELGFHLEKDQYFFPRTAKKEFNDLVRLMIFIELGDIETIELPAGRNNGKTKNKGKVTNQSNYTVYVVDSSWNQIIIRTDGFAVRGHFRLQPTGPGFKDRKLIWISAFEKLGYRRRPKAEIIK